MTNIHKHHVKQIVLSPSTEAYIQCIVLKKTLESIFYDCRRGVEDEIQDSSVRDLIRVDTMTSPAPLRMGIDENQHL